MKRYLGLVAALSTVAFWAVPASVSATSAPAGTGEAIHFYPTHATLGVRGAQKPLHVANMTYHGGPIEKTPLVYISWWGPEWSSGFSTGGYTSAQAQTYTTDFFSNVGGSSWNNTVTQYCQGVPSGTVNCGQSGTHITNPTAELKGTWNDTTAVPSNPSQTDIANAATRLMQHFGYSSNATYVVYTPTGKSMSGFGTSWCAWHSLTSSGSGPLAYAYMPYQPDAGYSCGENFVNPTNDSFGNGYFDGFSVVGGHEYAEAETDPNPSSGSFAWEDSRGNEIGDKCAWSASSGNITLGGNAFAVQPLWSNTNNGCVMSH